MRWFKGFLIALTGFIILITVFSFLIPSGVTTVRSVVINSPVGKIQQQLFNINNWKHWHPLFMQDSNNIITSYPPSGNNAYAEWKSGGKKNKIVFTELLPTMLKASLERTGENPTLYIISLVSINDNPGIQVEWRTFTRLKWYPWEKFAGIFADKISGPGYEAALQNLKQFCESH